MCFFWKREKWQGGCVEISTVFINPDVDTYLMQLINDYKLYYQIKSST